MNIQNAMMDWLRNTKRSRSDMKKSRLLLKFGWQVEVDQLILKDLQAQDGVLEGFDEYLW